MARLSVITSYSIHYTKLYDAKREGSPLGATPKVFEDRVEWLADDHEIDIPLDKDKADVLCTMSSIEIMKYPDSVVATARVMT